MHKKSTRRVRRTFWGSDPSRNFRQRSTFEMFLIFSKNAWKSPKKRRETILSVRETISKVNFFEYCQILKCSFLSKTHTLSNKSVGKPFLWVGETIYMSKWFKYVKSWNVLIFHQIAYTSEYTCRESIFRVREPILRVKTFKKSHF